MPRRGLNNTTNLARSNDNASRVYCQSCHIIYMSVKEPLRLFLCPIPPEPLHDYEGCQRIHHFEPAFRVLVLAPQT